MKETPKAGERYIIREPFEAGVLTHWRAPFTGGSQRVLPRGLEFRVAFDPSEVANAVSAEPTSPQDWEPVLVEETDRSADKYAGYSLVIQFEDLSAYCDRVG